MVAAAPKIAPNTTISIITPIKEITSPAIDKPFGVLKTPTNEKIKPNNHRIQPNTGTIPKRWQPKLLTSTIFYFNQPRKEMIRLQYNEISALGMCISL